MNMGSKTKDYWVLGILLIIGFFLITLPGIVGNCPYLHDLDYERSVRCYFLDYSIYLGVLFFIMALLFSIIKFRGKR